MSRVVVLMLCAALGLPAGATSAQAGEKTQELLGRYAGEWIGSGQLLFGPQTGLQFHCELDGKPSRTQPHLRMTGRCWMAGLSARVHGLVRYDEHTDRIKGEFMGGAAGQGVDISGSPVANGVALDLSRPPAEGRVAAENINANQMTVMMYLGDPASDREVAVAAMGFTRKEASAVGLPRYLPEIPTGSIPAPAQ